MLPVSSSSYNPLVAIHQTTGSPDLEALAWAEVKKVYLSLGWTLDHLDKTQFSPLLMAVKINNLELCKKILDLGLPINRPQEKFEFSALQEAMASGFDEIALFLIEKGADVNLKLQTGWTYLHLAVMQENTTVAEALIKANPLLLEARADIPDSNLSWSKFSTEPMQPLNTISITPLTLAMMHPNVKHGQNTAVFLLKQGAKTSETSPNGYTLLHLAATRGYDEVCQILINQGLDVNAVCTFQPRNLIRHRFTPLYYAALNQQVKTAKLLLEHKASYKVGKQTDESPFVKALFSGNEEMIQLFLDQGEKLDQENAWTGGGIPLLVSILNVAKEEKRLPLFELFLKLGLNIDHRFSNQMTYLHAAVRYNLKWLCECLLKQGADINAKDAEQSNVLHHAAILNHRELISFLLSQGADARALQSQTFTPLMVLEEKKLTASNECLDLKKAEQGLSALMRKLRMLGLRYSLSGKALEGSVRFLPYLELAESLQDYLNQNATAPAILHSFPEMIKQSPFLSPEQVMLKLEQGEIVTLSSGWKQHETSIVLSKEFLIVGNRGDHSGEEPGMKIYRIKNPANLSEAIKTLIANRDYVVDVLQAFQQTAEENNTHTVTEQAEKMREQAKEKHVEFFQKDIIEVLDLERIHYIPQKEQVSGNCVWLGAKMGLMGGLILHLLRQNPKASLDDLLPQIKKMIAGWSQYDNLQSLSILEQVESIPELKGIVDFEALYEELFALNFLNEEVSNKLIQLRPSLQRLKSKPDSNSFLYAYKHQKIKLLKRFLELGVQPKIDVFMDLGKPQIDALLLNYLVKGSVKSNFSSTSGVTAFQYFCMKTDKTQALKLLKAWKAESDRSNNSDDLKTAVNSFDEYGFTPLWSVLIHSEDLKSCKELIELLLQCGADGGSVNKQGDPAIHFAIRNIKTAEDVEIFKSLLEACSDPTKMLNMTNSKGGTALDLALKNARPEILTKFLLEQGAKVTDMDFLTDANLDKSLFEYFLREGLKFNLRDSIGLNPLHYLCHNVNKEFALKLLMAWRSQCESLEDFNTLKRIINVQNQAGMSPLIMILKNSIDLEPVGELLSLMIECGADVSAVNINKQNALHYAISRIKRVSDLNILCALFAQPEEAYKALNTADVDLDTPMHLVTPDAEWSVILAKLLIDRGAFLLQNSKGQLPQIADKNQEVFDYYIQKYKKQN